MTAGFGSELTELIPLALVVAISPLSIIPAVLVIGLIHFAFEQEDLPFGLLLASTGTM